MNDKCKTKYPIMLIHGAGFRDNKLLNYWGRIPNVLEYSGATVYYGHQDSFGTIENNAVKLKSRINELINETGCEKFNLIAHSKGGQEARYMISTLGMADKIASLTTIATPHHGSKTMDILFKFPKGFFKFIAMFANLFFMAIGDKKPDFYSAIREFTTDYTKEFNKNNPDFENVYYQSYAAVMKNSFSDIVVAIPHFIVKLIEGENDGLVTPKSAKWTNFKGVLRGAANRGISHADEVDLRRRRFTKKKCDGCISDITEVYLKIAAELKDLGF